MQTKCGFVALIGRPNAGKSTLLNALANEDFALISHKINATRRQSNIIIMHDNAQIIFIDTPGIQHSAKILNQAMLQNALCAINDCDIVAFLAPISDPLKHYEDFLAQNRDKTHIVLLSKIDLVDKITLLKTLESYQKYSANFRALIPISSTKRVNLEAILDEITKLLPLAPYFYSTDIISSQNLREIYREKIRESLFSLVNKEIPYQSEVRIKRIDEAQNTLKIYAEIITEKESQKKIIIGSGGKSIKNISINARKKIEEISTLRVFLRLEVVCVKGWSKDKKMVEKMIE